MTMQKEWRIDIAPLLFFALIVGFKTYYLVGYNPTNTDRDGNWVSAQAR